MVGIHGNAVMLIVDWNLSEFRWAYQKGGIPIFSDLLDKGLWEHPLLEGCGAGAVHIPLGPWAKCTLGCV